MEKENHGGGSSIGNFSFDLRGELTPSEQGLIRGAVGILLLIVIYAVLTTEIVRRNSKEN